MTEKSPRRRYLAALVSGSVFSLAGCASVVDNAERGEPTVETADPQLATETPSSPDERAQQADSESGGGRAECTPRENQQAETTTTESGWSTDDITIGDPAISLSPVPLPDEDTSYATMGTSDEQLTVYGNWKCPYTRDFVVDQLPSLVDEFVRPGDVSVRFRSVAYRGGKPFLGADAPRSTRAGLAVWEADPESYWTYFTYVFANQPQERYRWGQADLLTRFAAAAGVDDPSAVREATTDESAFDNRIERTLTSADADEIWAVPRVVYDGEVTAPTRDASSTREQFRSAANR